MEEFKIKLKDMKDEELKSNIIKYNNDKLNNIRRSSYLNAFGAILSIKSIVDKSEEYNYLQNLSELDLFKDYTNLAVKLIDESIYEEDFSKNLKIAKKTRDDIYRLLKIVENYYIELSYIGNVVDYYGLKLKAEEYNREAASINTEKIVKLIHDKLEEYKYDYVMYNHIISQIVQLLPLRLTKDKFINIVENAIKRNLKASNKVQVEDKINYYKRQWDASLQYGYGFKFDPYFGQVQKLKNEDIKDKDLAELNEIVNSIIETTKDINELYNFILISGLIYNMIIVIYLSNENSIDKDILELKEKWNHILISNDTSELEQFMKTNEKIIREVESNTIVDIEEFQELNKEAVKRENFIDRELEEIFQYTKEVLTYYNDYNLNNIDLILSKDSKEVSDLYLNEWVNSLSSYIDRSMVNMETVDRRNRMKKLLSLIELPFGSIGEFEDYISYSLNSRVSSPNEVIFIIENIIGFIQEIDNNTKK